MENIEVSRLLNMDNRTVASIKHRALEDIKSTLQEKNLSPSSFPGL
jgi:DNA-directed RNA polymerase specialized sigma24 family protein